MSQNLITNYNFTCNQCGECCRNFNNEKAVFLYPRDIHTISSKFNLNIDDFISNYCIINEHKIDNLSILIPTLEVNNNSCIFLKSNKCIIHDFKPVQCSLLPFNMMWCGENWFNYRCVEGIVIPKDWDTSELDYELIKELLEFQTELQRILLNKDY